MKTQIVPMDSVKLKAVTNASHTATTTMLLLALRERSRGTTTLNIFKKHIIKMGEKVVDEDYLAFWKGLQEAGVGIMVYGRRGNPDRFQWHYSLKQIAKAAIEGKESEAKVLEKRKPNPIRTVLNKTGPARRLYTLPLRNGGVAEVITSRELSSADLAKLRPILCQ